MKLLHFSDNHGQLSWLNQIDFSEIDLIVSSGDFFPNCSRGDRKKEITFQTRWFEEKIDYLCKKFAGLPVLAVDGNHDYIPLAGMLLSSGYSQVVQITPAGTTINGLKFAGFPNVPYFIGEWNRETSLAGMKMLVDETFESDPDILITHSPPLHILDGGIGSTSLLTAFRYIEHKITHHLFGHCHDNGGEVAKVMEVKFYNSACTWQIIEI